MKRLLWVGAGGVAIALVVGLALFEPWRLFTSSEIDEAPPTSAADPAAGGGTPGGPGSDGSAGQGSGEGAGGDAGPMDRELARADFIDAEHGTDGTALVLELADGARFVRFEDLATSDGPDLHVWLSDQPSGGEWGSYDDGRFIRLGELKATHGNQNYEIPADADLAGMRSVVIWCDRFNVAFGTAAVEL